MTIGAQVQSTLAKVEHDYGVVRLWIAGHPTWAVLVSVAIGAAGMWLKLKVF